jgi:hypothetical protein
MWWAGGLVAGGVLGWTGSLAGWNDVSRERRVCNRSAHQYVTALKEAGYELIARINGYIAYLNKCKQGAET